MRTQTAGISTFYMTDKWKRTVWMYVLIEDTLKITEITWFGMCYSLYISIDVQEDNTVDKGLISAPFALLSLRVRPVRVDQVPERGRNHHLFDS